MLAELDPPISGAPHGSLDWLIHGFSTDGLKVELRSRSLLPDVDAGNKVASAFVDGFRQIEQDGTTPPYFTERALVEAQRILGLIGKEGATGLVVADLYDHVELTAQASMNAGQLLRVWRQSIGSVEGRLETISLHGKSRFILYHDLTRKAVTCKFDPTRWLDEMKESLGHRVRVYGIVYSNIRGEPLRVEIDRIRRLHSSAEIPTIEGMRGIDPDFTGELSTGEFLRSVRGG